MLISIHPENPQQRLIQQVVEILQNDGVIVYPTDTIYGLGCDIYSSKAVARIARIKGVDVKKAQFTFVCSDLSQLSDYVKNIPTPLFRMIKKNLPGPYTFILPASKEVPKLMKSKKNTVGIRIPNHPITEAIIETLGHPIMSVSLPMDADVEYYSDPEIIHDIFEKQVDLVVNGEIGNIIPSTVVDCTVDPPEVIREGAGEWGHNY